MKTKVLFLVALVGVIFLLSCGHDSGNLIGEFQVVKKEKINPNRDYGFVTLINSNKDTLKMIVSMEEEYLNVKVGDIYLVGKNHFGYFLNNRPIKGVVGYSKIIQKNIDMGVPKCQVITRGQDTLTFPLSEVVYFNVSEGDFIFVKKNKDEKKPHYFVR
ncbi:MAG: hypothetical protein PWQ35_334 [Patescibacteria group bacterium]|nr:hypothetical protein [Patescibacteria group bacterium]